MRSVGERNRSTCVQLSFHCLLDRVVGSFPYNVQLKQGPTDFHRSSTNARFVIDEPVKRIKDRERIRRFRHTIVESVVLIGLTVFAPFLMIAIRVILPVIVLVHAPVETFPWTTEDYSTSHWRPCPTCHPLQTTWRLPEKAVSPLGVRKLFSRIPDIGNSSRPLSPRSLPKDRRHRPFH